MFFRTYSSGESAKTPSSGNSFTGSDVSENEVTLRELRHFVIDFDTTAKTFQMASQGICESLSATPQNGPATRVPAAMSVRLTAAEAGASNESTE